MTIGADSFRPGKPRARARVLLGSRDIPHTAVAGVLGAKLAAPDRPAISVCGDGAFFMHANVLGTAVEYNIPVVWVVWNNQAYASIRGLQRGYLDGRELATEFRHSDTGEPYSPDFAAMARSAGVEGVSIDRAAFGETRIGRGSKIDNLVQIGHAVRVGRNALLAAQVGIAGSTTIEADVVLAGQVGVNAHVTVGKGTRATGQTGITNTVPAGSFISGLPAIDNRAWRKAATSFRMLPVLRKRVAALERRLAELEGKTEERPEETGDSRPETEDD